MRRLIARIACVLAALAWSPSPAEVDCLCDHSDPATLAARECGLCQEAQKQPADASGAYRIFFLKDASPRKPNRTLVLPVKHDRGSQHLRDLSPHERTILWKAAIAKAQELWPDAWGLAVNAVAVRTQCHMHIHIGKLNEGVDESAGWTVAAPEQFPIPDRGCGVWLHPVPGGFHVHTDRDIAEPVLMR